MVIKSVKDCLQVSLCKMESNPGAFDSFFFISYLFLILFFLYFCLGAQMFLGSQFLFLFLFVQHINRSEQRVCILGQINGLHNTDSKTVFPQCNVKLYQSIITAPVCLHRKGEM